MITDEELESLPEDPQLAFVEFERIARQRLFSDLEEQAFGAGDDLRLEYMNKVVGAAKAFDVQGVSTIRVPTVGTFTNNTYQDFLKTVDHYTIQIRIHNASRSRKYSVALDGPTKAKIRHFVEQIKVAIDESDLPVGKKEVLHNKLNAFLSEVDRVRTPFQSLADAWLFFCGTVGDGFEKLEPARKWLDSIARLMGYTKELEDLASPRLPGSESLKRLEPPREETALFDKSDDDEIPF